MSSIYLKIDFDQYFDPVYGTTIMLPERCLLYRGYDTTYNPISNRPTHYSTQNVATGYAEIPNHTLGVFTTTHTIRLLDLRYICVILQQAFSQRPNNSYESLDPIVRVSIGYGLCSFGDQLIYVKRMFQGSEGVKAMEIFLNRLQGKTPNEMPLTVHPLTPSGIRIAETNNDGYICDFLKGLFDDKIDGFIAPRLSSIYHVEKGGYNTGEVVLFDPKKSGIVFSPSSISIKNLTLENLLDVQSTKIDVKYNTTTYRERRGGQKKQFKSQDPNGYIDRLEHNDPETLELHKGAVRAAQIWRKYVIYQNHYVPHPRTTVQSWWN